MENVRSTDRSRPVTDKHVADIYRAASGAGSWSSVLESLAVLTDSKFCFVGRYSIDEGKGTIEEWYNLDFSAVEAYALSSVGSVPWLARREFFQSAGLVWTGSQILSDEHLRTTDFCENFLQPLGVFHTLHAVIDISHGVITHVLLARAAAKPDFSPELCEVCRDLTWHLRSAFDLSQSMSQLAIVQKGFDTLLDSLPLGLVILDAEGAIIRMNELAQNIVSSFEHAGDKSNREIPASSGEARMLPAALTDAMNGSEGQQRFVLGGRNGRSRTYLTTLPLDLQKTWTDPTMSGKILLLCDLEIEIEVDEAALRMMHQLTPTEARLAGQIVAGARIAEAAQGMGMSENTARTHLKRIFTKTNSTRQSDLVRKLLMSSIPSTKVICRDA